MSQYKIYLISLNNTPKYIGFTSCGIARRWYQHKWDSFNRKNDNSKLHNAIRKYGIEPFSIQEIDSHDDYKYCLNILEKLWIKKLKTHYENGGYNITRGGEGSFLYKTIEEKNLAKKGKTSLYCKTWREKNLEKERLRDRKRSTEKEARHRERMMTDSLYAEKYRDRTSKSAKLRRAKKKCLERCRQDLVY